MLLPDDWDDDSEALRRVTPPIPVMVDLSRWVISAPDDRMAGKVPLTTRSSGFDIRGNVRGLLHGWLRSNLGSWLGQVEIELPTGDGERTVRAMHLCAERWIKPVKPE